MIKCQCPLLAESGRSYKAKKKTKKGSDPFYFCAKKLKKPQSFVSKYETGERKLDFVEVLEICKVCGVSIKEFEKIYTKKL